MMVRTVRWSISPLVGILAWVACSSGTRMQAAPARVPADSLTQAVNLREASRHDAAAEELERVLAAPVSPSLRAEAQWELYVTHRERGDSRQALEALVACATAGSPSPWLSRQLHAHIGGAVVAAVDGGTAWSRVQTLLQPLAGSPLLLDVAASLLDAGRCRAASGILAQPEHDPDPERAGERRDLLHRVARCLEQGGKTLGLVVPLSGEYAEYGASLARGVEMALEDTMVLAVQIEDSRSDAVGAVKAVQRLAAAPDVIAAIGPLQSRAATGAAVAAAQGELPLLVPLSAPTGLGQLGPWIFQSTVPLQAEARAVARYGMVEGGLSRFAVLYPAHTSGERAMEAFRDQVLGLGGDVVALERYTEGRDTNFRDQIVNLKRAAPQAVFVPGEPRELVQIVRQIAFYDLQCQLLGMGTWGLPEVISQSGRLVEGVIFADLVAVGRNPHVAELFAARYHDKHGVDPDHYAGLGFDLASVVWDEVSQGAASRDDFRRNLARREAFEGVSGILNWRDEDVAHDVRLYTISGGLAVPLQTRSP